MSSRLLELPFNALDTPRGAILAIAAVFLGVYALRCILFSIFTWALPPKTVLPSMPRPIGGDYREAISQGFMKYPDQAWVMPFEDPTVILPHSTLESQLKTLPESTLSFNANIFRRFCGKYTGIGTDNEELKDATRFDLAKSLHGLMGVVAEEIEYCFQTLVGSPAEWTSFDTYHVMLQTVALSTGRVFVGLPLSRDEQWVEATVKHAIGVAAFSNKLRKFPTWLRPLVAPFLPERWEFDRIKNTVTRLLDPIIRESLSTMHDADSKASVVDGETGRMTRFLLHHYAKGSGSPPSASRIVRDHLTLAFAAVHIPTIALTHALHHLAAEPEYLDILRAEIDVEFSNCKDGVLDTKALANLVKLDSFLKESMRVNPSGTISWMRSVNSPIHLSNGQIVPKDSLIAYSVPRYNPTLDHIENPEQFDGLRYVKLAQANGPQTRFKLDSTSADSLGFGYGSHSCPGRSFSAPHLKLVMAHMLRDYDIRFEEGKGRPENICVDFQIIPNPEGRVLLRARQR